MFVPFITIIPGMIAAVLVAEIVELKNGEAVPGGASGEGVAYNDSLLYLMRDLLPNGLLGLAITGLLAAFMAGMAANISAFNTVFSYDLWQRYIRKDRSRRLLPADRPGRDRRRRRSSRSSPPCCASSFSNIMDYLQTLFGFFNAPLFATFILGMFWKRMTAHRRLDRAWSSGTLAAVLVAFLSEDAFGSAEPRRHPARRPGRGLRRGVGRVRRRHRPVASAISLVTKPEAGRGLVGSGVLGDTEGGPSGPARGTPTRGTGARCRSRGSSLAMVIVLNILF